MEINIEDPSLEDMFLHRKGTIKCHVKVNEGAVERIFWEDEDLNEMAGASKTPPNGKKGQFTHDLAITYDEWIQGIKRYCVVELVDGMEPFKKLYDRNTGKTILQFCTKSLCLIPLVVPSNTLFLSVSKCSRDFLQYCWCFYMWQEA